jgi:hypothetical protein
MADKNITINLDSELYSLLEKRAKKSLLDIDDLIADILRRSMLSYKKKTSAIDDKIDDSLVKLFSRQKKGRKRKV